jgi:thymidylate kinase
MNIVIEGPDGSGKTSVAEALSKKTGKPYIRCPGSTKVGEFLRPLLKNCRHVDKTVRALLFAAVDYDAQQDVFDAVFDRSGISGIVYRIAAGEPESVNMLRLLITHDRSFILPCDPFVVVLDASDQVLDARMNLRGDEKDEGSFFRSQVRKVYRSLPKCVHRIYTDNKTVDEIVCEIEHAATPMTLSQQKQMIEWIHCDIQYPSGQQSAIVTEQSV